MEKYIHADKLKQFFRGRNRDLFSVDTICAILDLTPDEDCRYVGTEKPPQEYTEITNRIQQEDNMNRIYCCDAKGNGGAHHKYLVLNGRTGEPLAEITFQNGPRHEARSEQGVLDSDLLEIVRHRMKAFAGGDMQDDYTKNTVLCVEGALGFLNLRKEDRKKRGVLGTMNK